MIKILFSNSTVLICMFWYFANPVNILAKTNDVYVAVATNFYNPFREIAVEFEKKTPYKVKIISGSTGKLYAQIINGAPFEIFLSADSDRPMLLEQKGRIVAGTRFTFALGKITLWSPNPRTILNKGKYTLRNQNFSHIAIANPITAPYGKASLQALKLMGLWDEVQSRIIHGENIGQTFQFVYSENVALGFVALSQVLDPKNKKKGSRWDVPNNFYDPLKQDAVILIKGRDNPGARDLWKFLGEDLAKNIIKKYGYGLP